VIDDSLEVNLLSLGRFVVEVGNILDSEIELILAERCGEDLDVVSYTCVF